METTIFNFFRDYWWLWVIQGVAVLWGLSLLLVRSHTLKRFRTILVEKEAGLDDNLDIPLVEPQPQDQEALALLKAYRRRYLLKVWPDTRLSFRQINDLAQTLVTEIARIYYPQEERPELKASLADLVALYRRVGERLSAWLETVPFRPLREMDLATVLYIHDAYRKVKDHPAHQFLQRNHLYRAARWLWGAVNVVNPYYWGRRAAYRGSREFLVRMFLAKVVTVVGEEAIHLYSRRSPNLRLFQVYQAGLQELLNLALTGNGALAVDLYLNLMNAILKISGLEDREKVALLKRLARAKHRESGLAGLKPSEQKEVQEWLACQVKSCWQGPERQELLAQVKERCRELGEGSAPEALPE
jgi:hypothetical protein